MASNRRRLEELLDAYDGFTTEVPSDLDAALRAAAADVSGLLRALPPGAASRAALAIAAASPVDRAALAVACEAATSEGLAACEPRDLVVLLGALAAAGHHENSLLETLSDEVASRAGDFDGEDLARAVLAFAELGFAHAGMLTALSAEVLWKIDSLSARTAVQVAESLVQLGYCDGPALEWLAERALGRPEEKPSGSQVATMLWACGHVA